MEGTDFDVIIVGAGTAGCYLAKRLFEHGINASVIEQSTRTKVDSGIVSQRFFDYVPDKSLITSKIRSMDLKGPNGSAAKIRSSKPFAFLLDRERLGRKMRDGIGAEISTERFLGCDIHKGWADIRTGDNRYSCKLLVGADGAMSAVRRAVGVEPPELTWGVLCHTEEHRGPISVYFNKDYSSDGFAWNVPATGEIGVLSSTRPNECFQHFAKGIDVKIKRPIGAPIPAGACRSYADRTLLVGDAAGQTKPLSVDYSEPVLVRECGLIKNIRIGEFVNDKMEENEPASAALPIPHLKSGISSVESYSLNPVSAVTKFRPAASVLKHAINEDLLEIILEKGYRIRATGSHSVMSFENYEIVPKEAQNLKIGDRLLVSLAIPNNENLSELKLIPLLLKHAAKVVPKLYVTGGKQHIYKRQSDVPRSLRSQHWRLDSIPLDVFVKRGIVPENVSLSYKGSELSVPSELKITRELCRLLGYYVSEGCSHTGRHVQIVFGKNDEELLKDFMLCAKAAFGLTVSTWKPSRNPKTGRVSAYPLSFGGVLLTTLFSHCLKAGKCALDKEVPFIIFNVRNELKLEFLKAYLKGDGSCRIRMPRKRKNRAAEILATTVSRKLASDLVILALQLGMFPSIREHETPQRHLYGKLIGKSKGYRVVFSRKEDIEKLIDAFPKQKLRFLKFSSFVRSRATLGLQNDVLTHKMIKDIFGPRAIKGYRDYKSFSYAKLETLFANGSTSDERVKRIRSLIDNKVALLSVKRLRKVKPTASEVFDVEVPGANTFIGGLGPIVLHNTGGGIVWGMTCADIAAKAINYAFDAKRFDAFFWKTEYENKWQKAIGSELKRQLVVRNVYRKLSNEKISQIFNAVGKTLERETSGEFDYDAISKLVGLGTKLSVAKIVASSMLSLT